MEQFSTKEQYFEHLKRIGVVPEGFRLGIKQISFFPEERPVEVPLPMNLVLILLDKPSESFGALFTRNKFPGAPVLIGRRRLNNALLRGVLINNKISNVGAPGGVEDAEEILEKLASVAGGKAEEYVPASTGIIGWKLPKQDILHSLPELTASVGRFSCADAAKAIMTTDAYPKVARRPLGNGSLVGFAKGAGMIEPNLATMLVFLLTDVTIPRQILRKNLQKAAEKTFNCISVDGDQSTSDTVLCLSSGIKDPVSETEFLEALQGVCGDLAEHIVRNGEGTAHVIRVRVCSGPNFDTARALGKAVVNSPLVKTAVFGNDPNVGRILSSLGDYAGNHNLPLDPSRWTLQLGQEVIFSQSQFQLDKEKELRLAQYLKDAGMDPAHKPCPPHGKTVDIQIDLDAGLEEATVLGSDLSYEYVKENADYRS